MKTLASSFNCQLLAEGVNHQQQLEMLVDIGIFSAHGYYFGEPSTAPVINLQQESNLTRNHHPFLISGASRITIEDICKRVPTIESTSKVKHTLKILQKFNEEDIFPVINNNIPVGLISKNSFLSEVFRSNYGLDLFGHKPITEFMEDNALIIESCLSIEEVSQKLTSNTYFNKAFIVTHHGIYRGIGLIIDLLQAMTHLQIQNAQHANPLTLLPGSHFINALINDLLSKSKTFAVAYFDLDNFKPYNDIYGYNQGDEIIKLVANILKKNILDTNGYIGHIGGDDFIVIFLTDEWLTYCQNILQEFGERVLKYYQSEHRQARCITSYNRQGEICTFPLLSLSIGIVTTDGIPHGYSHVDIADLASEAKHQAKLLEGNSYFVNRRLNKNGNISGSRDTKRSIDPD